MRSVVEGRHGYDRPCPDFRSFRQVSRSPLHRLAAVPLPGFGREEEQKKGGSVSGAALIQFSDDARSLRLGGLGLGGQVFAGFLVDDLHRELGLAAVVEGQELDLDHLAFGQDVGGAGHAFVADLGDVDQEK